MLYVIGFAIRWSLIFFALKAFLGLDSLPDFNSQHFLGTANGLILQLSFVASATYEVIRMAFRLRARPRNTTMERSEGDDEKNGNTYIHLHAGTNRLVAVLDNSLDKNPKIFPRANVNQKNCVWGNAHSLR